MELAECARSWNVLPAAEAGYRLDGRRMDEVVPAYSVSGSIKQVPASAEVRMGDTHVLATARVRYKQDVDASSCSEQLCSVNCVQVSLGGSGKDEGSAIQVAVFLAPGSAPVDPVQGKDEQEVLLQNKLHTLLFGRPDGTPTDLERCLTHDEEKVTFLIQVDCVAMHMESESSVLDAMSVGTKKALMALDVKALNEAVVSAAEAESFTGIDASTYYAEVNKLPSIVSTGLVGTRTVLGCTREEESVAACKAHIALDTNMRLCGLRWSGMTDLNGLQQMLSASQHAVNSGVAS